MYLLKKKRYGIYSEDIISVYSLEEIIETQRRRNNQKYFFFFEVRIFLLRNRGMLLIYLPYLMDISPLPKHLLRDILY